jgi:hypothetical protein
MRKADELSTTTQPAAFGRHELAAARGARREEGDVDALEGVGFQLFHLVRLAIEFERLADRAGRSEQLEGRDREGPSLEDAEDFHSDSAGGADDGDVPGGDVLGVHGRGTYKKLRAGENRYSAAF